MGSPAATRPPRSAVLSHDGSPTGAGDGATFAALAYLATQASPTATFVAGLLVAALALAQRSHLVRLGALFAGATLAVSGLVGIVATAHDRAAADKAAGDITRGQLLPDTPTDALLTLMRAVSRPNDPAGCSLLDDPGRVTFASAYRAPDCPSALRAAGAGVIDPNAYDRIDRDSIAVEQPNPAGPAVVDGCAVRWRPTLDQLLNGTSAGTHTRPPARRPHRRSRLRHQLDHHRRTTMQPMTGLRAIGAGRSNP